VELADTLALEVKVSFWPAFRSIDSVSGLFNTKYLGWVDGGTGGLEAKAGKGQRQSPTRSMNNLGERRLQLFTCSAQ
jgi:hypothetical protein